MKPISLTGRGYLDKRGVTIYDIAREAGVSAATVSRVLTGSASVRPEKAERVRALIKKYSFHPNAMAKGLSETRSKIIGMLCADVANPYYASVFAACERAALDEGYILVSFTTMSEPELEIRFLNKLSELRVEAVIICGGRADLKVADEVYAAKTREVAVKTPVVVGGKLDVPECHQVCIDYSAAMDIALAHLLSLHHRDIAFLMGSREYFITGEKLNAFRRGMESAGLPVRNEWIVDAGKYDVGSGICSMDMLFEQGDLPTAVIAINDQVAAGAIQSVNAHGLSVPGDISVLGFDGTFITDAISPRLTSVANDYPHYGRMLVRAAVAAIEKGEAPRIQLLRPALSVKNSCKSIDKQ